MGASAIRTGSIISEVYTGGFRRVPTFLLEVGVILLILITYDVNTTTVAGKKRLRQVAKKCLDHGQRVQNSVFECSLDSTQFRQLKFQLEELINKDTDSLRFYNLGDNYKSKVEHIGAKETYDIDGPLIV